MFLTSLLISCLFALAPISHVPQIVHDQQNNVLYENKSKNNYAQNLQSYYYANSDLLNDYFVIPTISYIQSQMPNSNFGTMNPSYVGETWEYTYTFAQNSSLLQWQSFTSGDLSDYGYVSSMYVRSQLIGATNNYYQKYYFRFFYTHDNEVNYNFFSFYVSRFEARSIISFVEQIAPSSPTSWTESDSISFIITENTQNSYHFITDMIQSRVKEISDSGYNYGYNVGLSEGKNIGYGEGLVAGLEGATNPQSATYQQIFNEGKQVGYSEGLEDGLERDSVASTIFTGFVDVGLLPVNVFLQMFEYEVFGINIAGLMSGVLTIAIVVIIVRLVTGKKND